jgi:hypothetical protein
MDAREQRNRKRNQRTVREEGGKSASAEDCDAEIGGSAHKYEHPSAGRYSHSLVVRPPVRTGKPTCLPAHRLSGRG